METIGLRELRQNASELVRRAEAGERVTVTVSGRPVAELGPVSGARTWRRMADLTGLFEVGADSDWAADRERIDQETADPFLRGGAR